METKDMDIVRDVTPYVTGISKERGGAATIACNRLWRLWG
jgi:hypothetical protein